MNPKIEFVSSYPGGESLFSVLCMSFELDGANCENRDRNINFDQNKSSSFSFAHLPDDPCSSILISWGTSWEISF